MFRRLACLFAYLFHRGRLEDDIDAELRSSFEMLVDRKIANGMSRPDALRAARLEFESIDQVKENVRDGLIGSATVGFLQDLRYAWRGLRRRPSFACIAI